MATKRTFALWAALALAPLASRAQTWETQAQQQQRINNQTEQAYRDRVQNDYYASQEAQQRNANGGAYSAPAPTRRGFPGLLPLAVSHKVRAQYKQDRTDAKSERAARKYARQR